MDTFSEIPIKIEEKIVGVIRVDEKAFRESWGEESLKILRAAGALLSIAIKNAHLEEEIRMLDSVRTDFISSFPHELRTPITVMKDTFCMLMDETLGPINEKQKKALQLASDNLERLWRLSEELLELSAIAMAKAQMKRKQLDITALVKHRVSEFQPIAEKFGVLLFNNFPDKEIKIWGDEYKLAQALDCLMDNAIKYNRKGGRVDLSLEETTESSIKIHVSDTGPGIIDGDLDLIFDKFYRITMSARSETKKWGIGLPVVREIIEMHRGSVSAKSDIGKGSTFTIILPKSLR